MSIKTGKGAKKKGVGSKPVKKPVIKVTGKPVKKPEVKAPDLVVRVANLMKMGVVDKLVNKVVSETQKGDPPSVEICENCGDTFDSEIAEMLFCPECGAMGTDQCCMNMGENEPCRLCRNGDKDEDDDEETEEIDDYENY